MGEVDFFFGWNLFDPRSKKVDIAGRTIMLIRIAISMTVMEGSDVIRGGHGSKQAPEKMNILPIQTSFWVL